MSGPAHRILLCQNHFSTQTLISPSHSLRRPLIAAVPKTRPQNCKQQHTEADLLQEDLPLLPSKKFKLSKEHHSASRFPLPEFWDSLLKVWLTRQALRELDQRNQLSGACPLAHKPLYQFSGQKDLWQFARHSSLQLGDLQGVS